MSIVILESLAVLGDCNRSAEGKSTCQGADTYGLGARELSLLGVAVSDKCNNSVAFRETDIVIPSIHLLDCNGIPSLDSSSCWHLREVEHEFPTILRDLDFAFGPRVIVPRDELGANRGVASPIPVDLELVEFNDLARACSLVFWTTMNKQFVCLLKNTLMNLEFMSLIRSFSIKLEEQWTLVEFPATIAVFPRI